MDAHNLGHLCRRTCVPCAAPDGTPVSPSCVQSVVSLPEIHLHTQPGGQSEEEEEEEEEGEGEAASSARKGTSSWARRAIILPPSVVTGVSYF